MSERRPHTPVSGVRSCIRANLCLSSRFVGLQDLTPGASAADGGAR